MPRNPQRAPRGTTGALSALARAAAAGGGRGAAPLPAGSPGGAQTPMGLPPNPYAAQDAAAAAGQPPNPFFGNTGLTPADLQPQPTSLSSPQTGIDYGQDLPGIMEQYKSRGRLKNLVNKSGRGNNGR